MLFGSEFQPLNLAALGIAGLSTSARTASWLALRMFSSGRFACWRSQRIARSPSWTFPRHDLSGSARMAKPFSQQRNARSVSGT